MSFTPVTLQATRANPDGSPASGTISFTLNSEMLNGTESVQPAPISGVLNPDGQLVQQNGQPIILLANDDSGTTPADPSAAYVVQENINGSSVVEYSIIVSHTDTIVDTDARFTAASEIVHLSNVLASSAMVGQTLVDSTNFPSGVGITAYDPTQNTLTLASNATSTVTESATISGAVDLSTLAQYEPAPTIQTYIPFNLGQSDGQVATWDADTREWIATTPSGGGSTILSLSFNGVGPFDVPVSSLPTGWSGSGIAAMVAQLTTGDGLITGLEDSYGNPIPDGFTFPATIFVEGSTIYDIVALNAYVGGNPGQVGYSWWNEEGGVPMANISPSSLIITNLPTTDPAIAGAFWNYNGQIVASGFTPSSGLPAWFQSGDGDPIVANPTVPNRIGARYMDTSGSPESGEWVATNSTSADWVPFGALTQLSASAVQRARGFTFLPVGPGESVMLFAGPVDINDRSGGGIALTSQVTNGQVKLQASGYGKVKIAAYIDMGILGGAITFPLVVVTGVNDTFVYTPIDTGIPETFTFAAGTLVDVVDVANAMLASIGSAHGEAFSTISGVAPSQPGIFLSYGAHLTLGDTLTTGPTDILADIGFTSPATAIEFSDSLEFFQFPGATVQTVIGALSEVTDPAAKAVLTSLLNALGATHGYGLFIDGTT